MLKRDAHVGKCILAFPVFADGFPPQLQDMIFVFDGMFLGSDRSPAPNYLSLFFLYQFRISEVWSRLHGNSPDDPFLLFQRFYYM